MRTELLDVDLGGDSGGGIDCVDESACGVVGPVPGADAITFDVGPAKLDDVPFVRACGRRSL